MQKLKNIKFYIKINYCFDNFYAANIFLNKIKKYLIAAIVNLYEFSSLKSLYTVIYSNNYINILHK